MSEGNPLINVGDISKPVTVLIEKISDAIGGSFAPWQMQRIAQAEVEAGKIRALGEIKISEIQQRGLLRVIHQEGKVQENIEQISKLAIQDLRPDAKPENMENDWISYFFDKCRLVSDTDMQGLWARILAGEANQPSSFSRRTVGFVSSLDKSDALLFTNLCKFCWNFGGLTPLIYDLTLPVYQSEGIVFTSLTHLDDIGLISFNELTGYLRDGFPKKIILSYYGRRVIIEFAKDTGNEIDIGKVMLTQVGQELSSISGSTPSDLFFDYVCKKLQADGCNVYREPPSE